MIRVLLIDNDDHIRTALSHMLNLQYFEVVSTTDGSGAIEEITNQKYDLIVVDVELHKKESLATIENIRKVDPHIPILAISDNGKATPEMSLSTIKMMGATDSLEKPLDSLTLIHKIQNLLRH